MKVRNLILKIHGAIGIVMGLLLAVVSLTGAAILFQEELDQALNRSLFYVTPQAQQVSIDQMLAPIQSAHPELPLWFIQTPKHSNESYVINQKLPGDRRLQTFVNPYTGKPLGSRVWEHSLIGFFYTVHHDLFAGVVGQILVGVTGVFLLLMALTGVLLWTGWRKLASGFKIRWQAPIGLLSYDLHNVGGFFAGTFLAITAFTGVIIVLLHLAPLLNASPKPPVEAKKFTLPIAQLMRTADASLPEGQTTSLFFAEDQPEKLLIRKKLPDQETGRFDLSTVLIDRASGKVLETTKVAKPEGMFKALVTIADLHFGTFGGLPTRILYIFVGLMPTVLLGTGLVNWRRKHAIAKRV